MIGVLFSGGLESTSLLQSYIESSYEKISLLYIKCGYRWEEAELFHAKKVVDYYKNLHTDKEIDFNILNLGDIFKMKHKRDIQNTQENILPMRNLFLLTNASMFFLQKDIIHVSVGIQGSDEYPDTNSSYIKNIEDLVKVGASKEDFKILTPFYGKNKDDIVKLYADSIPLELLFSCTEPIGNSRCNRCYKCQKLNKIKDKFR